MRGLQLAHRALPSSILQYRKHSTAQHSTAQHSTAQAAPSRKVKYMPSGVRQRKQADREHLRTSYSIAVPQEQHSTAQRNQPSTKQQTKYVPIRARQRKLADRAGENQNVAGRVYSSLRFQNEEIKNIPGLKQCTTSHKAAYSRSWCDARMICLCFQSQ